MPDYFDLGNHTMPVTTNSPEAQVWFDRGLLWTYGYNHEEAVRCFQIASDADPGCAMAFWGIAYASGPNYNKEWSDFDQTDLEQSLTTAYEAANRAVSLVAGVSSTERDLIRAVARRYPSPEPADDPRLWNVAYADAMRGVYREHGDNLNVAALFAEALMNLTPWQMWDVSAGTEAAGAATVETTEVLEQALTDPRARNHPAVLHLYVHLMEMSPHPERALRAADWLRNLVPDAGHLQHMPSHIDVLCGAYDRVVESNDRAIAADKIYLERFGALNFYSTYRCHDYHFKLYGAMFLGQFEEALDAAEEMIATLTPELLEIKVPPMADWLEGFVGMKTHVLVRFGKWQELIDQPLPDDQHLYNVTTALLHYGKGIAYAATGDPDGAEEQQNIFTSAVGRVPETRRMFNNTWHDIFAVAAAMLRGEIEYRRNHYDAAFSSLRTAIELEDALPYDEPWGWMQPTRHAYGALLLEQGHVEEAEAVYRADLGLDGSLPRPYQHPDNIWSLHGLHECLVGLEKLDEALMVRQRLELARARADVTIESSCYCRLIN